MKIGVIGSMQFTEDMLDVAEQLRALGHYAYTTSFTDALEGKSDQEKERIKLKQKYEDGAIREFWHLMQDGDAVLALNLDKHGIKNYIGGNTFLELGFAHVLDQEIYLWNTLPDIDLYKTEIKAMNPTVINGDLSQI